MSDRGQLLVEPILPLIKPIFLRYGFGFGKQGFSEDMAYTINSSAFEHNNFIVEISRQIQEAADRLKAIAQQGRQAEIGVTILQNYNLRPYRADRADKSTATEFDTKYEQNMSNTVTSNHPGNVYGKTTKYRIRKLTPRECFRLMGVDDADIDKIQAYHIKATLKDGTVKEKPIPKSQQYKMAGNSIVVDNIYHIFRTMFIANQPENKITQPIQKSLFESL